MTTSNETLNFEHAYIEMRNLLAYTLNVIAGEINDGVTPIDDGLKDDDNLKKRRQQVYDIVCSQTHALHKSVHPTTLDQHDELIKKFGYYLSFVSYHPDLWFPNKHPELNKIRCLTSNETLNFEHAYIEMRNLLAYTFNVIASEIGDGVTLIDDGLKDDEAIKKRRQLTYDIVCSQTHSLHKLAPPTNLEQHDELIAKFEYYLTFITCDAAPTLDFTDYNPELNNIRYPNFEKEYDLECEQFNRQSIDSNERN
ncbi:hypothetical protein ACU5EH_25625 [Aliivibrio salmonicida]|uniref:hypothetical protein n=1 Tax=Aliivibrio salmonicida TaxID=40269 RepID=UPI00406CBF32